MRSTIEIRREMDEILKTLRAILDTADNEKRKLTDDESRYYEKLDKEYDALKADVKAIETGTLRRAKLTVERDEMQRIVNPWGSMGNLNHRTDNLDTGGFENVGEYFWTILSQRRDGRADDRLAALAERREMQMSVGSQGGYAVPEAFSEQLFFAPGQAGIVRRFATPLPVVDGAPDAQESIPALDQTANGGTYGGVILTHGGEGVTLTESDMKLREVIMEPKQMNCYLPVTNKLLLNWRTSNQVITRILRDAVEGQIDYDCLRGSGVNQALGVINAACTISYARAGAGAVSFSDVYGMLARAKLGGNLIWIASQTVIPQLAAMVDAGNHAVWLGGLPGQALGAAPVPSTLLGLPLFFSDRLPPLGTRGDLCLCDLSYYLLKFGSGPRVDISTEFLFTQDKSVFRIIAMIDGRPWLTEPLGLEGATSSTVSPFVVLE